MLIACCIIGGILVTLFALGAGFSLAIRWASCFGKALPTLHSNYI